MLEIFIFVNLDDDSAAISKKCQYFLDRGSGVTAEAQISNLHRWLGVIPQNWNSVIAPVDGYHSIILLGARY